MFWGLGGGWCFCLGCGLGVLFLCFFVEWVFFVFGCGGGFVVYLGLVCWLFGLVCWLVVIVFWGCCLLVWFGFRAWFVLFGFDWVLVGVWFWWVCWLCLWIVCLRLVLMCGVDVWC